MEQEELLMVRPINKEFVLEMLNSLATDKKENEEFRIFTGAYCCGVYVDNECCYSILDKKFFNGSIQTVIDIPVYIRIKKEGGYTMKSTPEFTLDISIEAEGLFLPECSLKEFMGSRYNYNPRIKTNMREFLKDIKS